MGRTVQITFDAADPARLADFWAAALGYELQAPPPGFDTWKDALTTFGVPPEQHDSRSAVIDPEGAGPRIFIQQVPEAKAGKNRLHLDLYVTSRDDALPLEERVALVDAKVAALVTLGAAVIGGDRSDDPADPFCFVTLQDPEGNEFCVS